MADSSRHALYAVPEATYGVTPTSSPTFAAVRHTDTNLNTTKDGFQSNELRSDAQIQDFRHGAQIGGGGFPFELSYTSFDVYLEALLGGTWAADVLKAGVNRRSFSLLRHFTDLVSGDKPYHIHRGQEFNTLSLNIPTSGIVTGTFDVIGQDMEPLADLSSLTTPTLGNPGTTRPFDSFSGAVTEGGSGIAIVTELSLNFTRGYAAKNVVGSDLTLEPSQGKLNLTGSLSAYFENAALLEKFLNETESAITFTLIDPAGNQQLWNIPRIVYTGGSPDTAGEGPVGISMPFQAMRDESEDSNIVITRTAI